MSLTIEQSQPKPDTVVFRLEGKLMLGSGCAELEKLVSAELALGRKTLLFDLAGVTHIDSTGMGRFIDTYNKLHKQGGKIALTGAHGGVRDMFRVTRLDTVFPFYDTLSDAEAEC